MTAVTLGLGFLIGGFLCSMLGYCVMSAVKSFKPLSSLRAAAEVAEEKVRYTKLPFESGEETLVGGQAVLEHKPPNK